MGRTVTLDADKLESVRTLLSEAVAIQELVTRVSGDNEEDFDMLQRACAVTYRLVEEAGLMLAEPA